MSAQNLLTLDPVLSTPLLDDVVEVGTCDCLNGYGCGSGGRCLCGTESGCGGGPKAE